MPQNLAPRRFFPVLDALRAVAVLCVVAYHIGLPFAPGGFVGVDVFFVISGFLIIGHIAGDIQAGCFSFRAFLCTAGAQNPAALFSGHSSLHADCSFVLVLPSEWLGFGEQVLWSGLMMANHYFPREPILFRRRLPK